MMCAPSPFSTAPSVISSWSRAKNVKVSDPTVNSLRVRWDAVEGDVRQYNVIYAPLAGGAEVMVFTSHVHCVRVLF